MKIVAVLMIFIPSMALAQAPSFDCALATSADEIAICADPELAELEQTLADAFQALTDQQGFKAAKSIATPILVQRRQCGSDAQCIYDLFRSAILKYQQAGVVELTSAPDNATNINELIIEWQDANGRCRDAEGAADIDQQCGLRDALADQLNNIGLCQGNYMFDTPDFQMATLLRERWIPCLYTELLN